MHIFRCNILAEFDQLFDLVFRKCQLLFVELVMRRNSSGIIVHDFLHRLFQGFDSKHIVGPCQIMVIFFYFLFQCRFFFCLIYRQFLPGIQFFYHMKCRDLAFDHRTGHVFLRTSSGDISCRIQSVDRRLAVGVHPVSAGGVSAHDIRFGSLNLDILLARLLAGFNPFECLAWCHIEVSFFQ